MDACNRLSVMRGVGLIVALLGALALGSLASASSSASTPFGARVTEATDAPAGPLASSLPVEPVRVGADRKVVFGQRSVTLSSLAGTSVWRWDAPQDTSFIRL